jgi:hypothetical protein
MSLITNYADVKCNNKQPPVLYAILALLLLTGGGEGDTFPLTPLLRFIYIKIIKKRNTNYPWKTTE